MHALGKIFADIAVSLRMKLMRLLTPAETAEVAVLKGTSPSFVVMRQLMMRFRGLLRGADPSKLNHWLQDARQSGAGSIQQFARTLTWDIEAVRRAIAEPRSLDTN